VRVCVTFWYNVVRNRVLVCTDDWLEIYNVYKDGTEKIVGRYCGTTAPGPLESNRGAIGLKILLHTNSEGVSSGFKARYVFDVAKPIFGGEYVTRSTIHGRAGHVNFRSSCERSRHPGDICVFRLR